MLRRALVASTCAAAAIAAVGCGGTEQQALTSALTKPIDSAHVSLSMQVDSGGQSQTINLDGPYKSNGKGKLPSVDMKLQASSLQGELITSPDDAFVVYKGESYEVGKDKVAQFERSNQGSASSSMSTADVQKLLGEARDWFPKTAAQTDASLNGEDVTRVTGKLDVSKALKDLKTMPGADAELKQLSQGDIAKVDKQISDPNFTVDVAKSDGRLRRIVASMTVNGDDGQKGSMRFELQFSDVDKPVTVNVPSSGKPISELEKQLQQDFGGSSSDSGSGKLS